VSGFHVNIREKEKEEEIQRLFVRHPYILSFSLSASKTGREGRGREGRGRE